LTQVDYMTTKDKEQVTPVWSRIVTAYLISQGVDFLGIDEHGYYLLTDHGTGRIDVLMREYNLDPVIHLKDFTDSFRRLKRCYNRWVQERGGV